jgi:hypothetical protein
MCKKKKIRASLGPSVLLGCKHFISSKVDMHIIIEVDMQAFYFFEVQLEYAV